MVQDCSLWLIKRTHRVEGTPEELLLWIVVSLDHVCGEESKNYLRRPGAVDVTFTDGRAVDADVVNGTQRSALESNGVILLFGLKQCGSNRTKPAIKRLF
jgi:hypothetical protein